MGVENNKIQYAFRVITKHTVDVPDIGLYDGELRFITGQTETGLTFEDGTTADGFLNNHLIDEPIKSPSRKIDISTGGAFNSLNSCTVTINNVRNWIQNALSNEVFLINTEIQVYIVIDSVMYSIFGGVLNDIRYNEKFVVFECKDRNELTFKQVPEDESSQLATGEIAYAKLKKSVGGDAIAINSFYAINYYQDTYNGKLYPHLDLQINQEFLNKYGQNNPSQIGSMAGLFINPRKFGSLESDNEEGNSIKILWNYAATFNQFTPNTFAITIVISAPFDDILSENMIGNSGFSSPQTLSNSPTLFNLDEIPTKYVFDIFEFSTKYYLSGRAVDSIERDENGKPIVYIYNENLDDGSVNSNPWTKVDGSVAVNNSTENPYITLLNNTSDITVSTYEQVRFKDCRFKFHDSPANIGEGTFADTTGERLKITSFKEDFRPWQNGAEFIDGDYTTSAIRDGSGNIQGARCYMTPQTDGVTTELGNGIMIDLEIPDSFNFSEWDSVYLGWGMQWDFQLNSASTTAQNVEFNFDTLDVSKQYQLVGGAEVVLKNFVLPPTNRLTMLMTTDEDGGQVPTQLYSDGIQQYSDYFGRVIFSPFMEYNPTIIEGKQLFSSIFKIGTDPISGTTNGYISFEQDLKNNMKLENDFTVIDSNGKKRMYLYPRIDPFEQSPTDRFALFYQIYDLHLICEKEISSDELYIKIKGEKFQGENIPADNVYNTFRLLIEDYNDLGVNINYTNLPLRRSNWDCARIVSSTISSKELLKDLAQQSFVGIYTNRKGELELDAFREDNDDKSSWVHDNSIIINKSIKSVKSTNVSKIYNDIKLKYNKNYATDKFTKDYYVTGVDKDDFSVIDADYSAFSDIPSYADANTFWNRGHQTYLRNGISQPLPKSLAECNWYRNLREFDENNSGVTNSSVHFYLENLVEWVTRAKNVINYSIPLNSDTIKIELLDRVSFNDLLITGDIPIDGWITMVGINTKDSVIDIEITTIPDDILPIYRIIDEHPDSVDEIDEEPISPDTVDETFTL